MIPINPQNDSAQMPSDHTIALSDGCSLRVDLIVYIGVISRVNRDISEQCHEVIWRTHGEHTHG
jgi:hypothetical protein